SREMVWEWIRNGWRYRHANNPDFRRMISDPAMKKKCLEKVNYEMQVTGSKDGFMDYFLMVADAVTFAKDAGIAVGPARGSAAASLVLYLLRITEVNPMMFPTMVFERFIDVSRADLPDIDLDFQDDRRHEVVEHLRRRWGADRVGNIGNFIRYKGKNSIDDVARVHLIPKWKTSIVKDRIIERSGGDSRASDSLGDTFETFPQTQAVLDEYPELGFAIRLEGNMRGMSVHAAGVVISNNPISDTCAVYTRDNATGGRTQVLA